MPISPSEPLWLHIEDVTSIQQQQVDLHGGLHGIRDIGLVLSALGRARNLHDIMGEDDVLILAVTLGVGIARNHGFIEGNKRTGAAAMIEFLALNGYWLDMPNDSRLGRLFTLVVEKRRTEDELVDLMDRYLREF